MERKPRGGEFVVGIVNNGPNKGLLASLDIFYYEKYKKPKDKWSWTIYPRSVDSAELMKHEVDLFQHRYKTGKEISKLL